MKEIAMSLYEEIENILSKSTGKLSKAFTGLI